MKLFGNIILLLTLVLSFSSFAQDDDSDNEPVMQQLDWEIENDNNGERSSGMAN